jgi:ammonium transporter Rh
MSFATLLSGTQMIVVALFLGCTTIYTNDQATILTNAEYGIFRDIMVMLLLGFGYLMTFLKSFGLSAVGITMALTVVAIQLNILIEPLIGIIVTTSAPTEFPLPVTITSLINGEFSAATLLISFGAIIGRGSPTQLLLMAILQAFFYAINKVLIVFGGLRAEDVGGTVRSTIISFHLV